jgi:hypothetical protein
MAPPRGGSRVLPGGGDAVDRGGAIGEHPFRAVTG